MHDKCPEEPKRSLSEIDDDIAKIQAEIEEKYYQLGKIVCEIADNDAEKIGELVDQLIEFKKERKAQYTERSEHNEPK